MVVQTDLIGPRLLDKPFNHQFNCTHLLVRLLLFKIAARRQLGTVGEKRLLQTKMFQRGDKPHCRNKLIFTDILPAFILRYALLQQAQLQGKF